MAFGLRKGFGRLFQADGPAMASATAARYYTQQYSHIIQFKKT